MKALEESKSEVKLASTIIGVWLVCGSLTAALAWTWQELKVLHAEITRLRIQQEVRRAKFMGQGPSQAYG